MKLKATFLTTALVFVSGCGGGGGAMTPTGNASGQLIGTQNAQTVQQIASLLSADVTTPQSIPNFTIPNFVSPYDGCRTYVIGSSTSDKHFKQSYNCRNINDGGQTMNVLGTLEYKAEDAADSSKGYRQTFDMVRENVGSYKDVAKGFDDLKRTATQVIFETDLTVDMKMENHNPAVDWQWKRALKTVYTPNDMTKVMDSGKMSVEGHFSVNGKIGGDANGRDLGITKLTFSIVSKDLTYDTTCTNFKTGTITFKDGAGNELVYTHACNTVTMKWMGQPFTW